MSQITESDALCPLCHEVDPGQPLGEFEFSLLMRDDMLCLIHEMEVDQLIWSLLGQRCSVVPCHEADLPSNDALDLEAQDHPELYTPDPEWNVT